MAESPTNSDVEEVAEISIESAVTAPKRTLENVGTVALPVRRVRRKGSDFGHTRNFFAVPDPDELETAKPPLAEVVISPVSRCSFGAEMVAAPLDPSNVRELVTSREEDALVTSTPHLDAGPIEVLNVSAAAVVDPPSELVVDPEIETVPMLLLGHKQKSMDKFYDLHQAMKCENITFLVATLKNEKHVLVQPIKCNLHEIVFLKHDAVTKWITSEWCSDAASMVKLVNACFQVSQPRTDDTGNNVCLYLRVDANIVDCLDGDAAYCAQFDSLKSSTGMNEAGLVMALDEAIVKKLKLCKESAAFLHADVCRAVSSKGQQQKYLRLDEFGPGDQAEHAAFKFRLKPVKVSAKDKRGRCPASARKPPTVSRQSKYVPSASPSGGPKTIAAAMQSQVAPPAPASVPPPSPPPPPAPPPPAQELEPPEQSSALVVGASVDSYPFENATHEQRRAWMEAGRALNATGGVQPPAYPGFPTTVVFEIDPAKVHVQPMGNRLCVLISN